MLESKRRHARSKVSSSGLEALESRELFSAVSYLATAAINGGKVTVYNAGTHAVLVSFRAYGEGYRGGVSVALGNVTGDGRPEIITAPTSRGAAPLVEVFSLAGVRLQAFDAFDPRFKGGVSVAVGDFTGDRKMDIVAAAGPGGGPNVKVFNGATNAVVRNFYAFDPRVRSGVNVAAADINSDGVADIIAGPKLGGGPVIRAFSGATGSQLLYEDVLSLTSFHGGIRVATGQMGTSGPADIFVATGVDTLPNNAGNTIIRFNSTGAEIDHFVPLPTFDGLSIAMVRIAGNPEIAVGTAHSSTVTLFDATTHAVVGTFVDPTISGGVEVATMANLLI
ncbi:MAG TPA: VCBS repeat-containing protein [Phycisphaerae bacterium]|nr:VCBS repeat-containing protein [Phycisphaerae bacterium]